MIGTFEAAKLSGAIIENRSLHSSCNGQGLLLPASILCVPCLIVVSLQQRILTTNPTRFTRTDPTHPFFLAIPVHNLFITSSSSFYPSSCPAEESTAFPLEMVLICCSCAWAVTTKARHNPARAKRTMPSRTKKSPSKQGTTISAF